MTFDPTKPVQTRDGRPARILCTDRRDSNYPIVALFTSDGGDYVACYTKAGGYYAGGSQHNRDLVNVPEKRVLEAWLNVYEGGAMLHDTKKGADAWASNDRIACIHIKQEYTAGEGL